MVRVLHIIDGRTPGDMLDQLALLAGRDDVIASIGPPPRYAGFELPVRPVHCPLAVPRLAAGRLDRAGEGTEFVHAWSLRAAEAAGALARRTGRRPLLSLPCIPTKRDSRPLIRLVDDFNFHVTVPTQAGRSGMVRAGMSESAVHLLPPPAAALDPGERQTRRSRTREALGVGDDQHLIVVPSQMLQGAGHKYASWAHAIVRQVRGDLLLLMPGGGPVERRVRFFAATTGYDDEVFFSGDRFARADVLAGGDVALFLAERETGLAAMAGAMAAGLPIVGSRLPGLSELAPHEEAGLLVPVRDPRAASAALLRVIEDPQLADRLATGAKERAERCFAPHVSRRELADIYAALPTSWLA